MLKKLLIGTSVLGLAAGMANAAAPNTVLVQQTGVSNVANADQTAATANTNSEIYIRQIGDHNTATTTQKASGGVAKTRQTGSNNVATQNENANPNWSTINQGAIGSDFSPTQPGGVTTQGVSNTFPANGNKATTSFGVGAVGHFTYVYQQGNTNSATLNINGIGAYNGTPDAHNFGNVATADVEQYSDSNVATVNQAGNANTTKTAITIFQGIGSTDPAGSPVTFANEFKSPGGRNTAIVSQYAGSDGSVAQVYQGRFDNYASIQQSGLNEWAEIRQDGSQSDPNAGNNSSDITQTGANTSALTYQYGISNKITLTQASANAQANLQQTGNLNSITVHQ